MLLAQPTAVPCGSATMESYLPLLSLKLAEDCQSGSARQGTVDLFRESFPDASISYVGMSIKGEGNWVATSDNYLRSGLLSLKLHPSQESLAGSAVACCALLTSADDGVPERMYDVEHVQSLGRDVVLLAIPMGTARPYTLSSGTAFPGSLALGALLVATDKQSATHPRVLTDMCCLAETLAPLIEQHARHAARLLQDFVLSCSSAGSPITAARMLTSPEGWVHQPVNWPEHASLRREGSLQSGRSTPASGRSRSLPQQVRRMSSSFLTRLRSQVRQSGSQAEAAASVLGRPKTPVQYVRVPAGPSAPLPNPFAGVLEGSQASPLQAVSPIAQQADSSSMRTEMLLEGQPPQQLQPSQQKAAKSAKWEMLLDTDEPEQPAQAEPSADEQSASSAGQPKMAMRFQNMIDSQELESKRQRSAATKTQGPSLSAAVYPAESSRQGSVRQQQGHYSMPPLLSSLVPSQQQHSRKLKPWEMLLAAQEPQADGSASTAVPDAQQRGSSRPQTAGDAQQSIAPEREQARPSVVDHSQMIARWERMLDKRSSQQNASTPHSATASLPGQPSKRAPGRAAGQSSMHQAPQEGGLSVGSIGLQRHTPQAGPSLPAAENMHVSALEAPLNHNSSARASRGALMPSGRPTAPPALLGVEQPQSSTAGIVPRARVAAEPEQGVGRGLDCQGMMMEGEQHIHSSIPVEQSDKGIDCLGSAPAEQHPLWLSFSDAALEQEFAWWHTVQMQKVDRISILFALLIFLYLGFCRPHRLAFAAPVLYIILMATMMFYFWLSWTQHPSYMLHRSKLIKALVVMYILFNTQVAFPRVLGGMTDANACTTAFVLRYINAQPLLTSCLTTMVRVSIHAPLQCLLLALSWRLPQLLCPLCFAAEAQWRCLLRMHALQLLVGFLVPTALMYIVEQRMRSTFLRSRHKKLFKVE